MTEGTFIRYRDIKPGPAKMDMIVAANNILDEYERKGLVMTLRQLYYQFVSRDLFANDQANYDRLKDAISDGRIAGLVSWTAIEDRTRNLEGRTFHDSPAAILKDARATYLTDRWASQPYRPEVWVEKEALAGIVEAACHDLCVNFFAVRGYNSQSEQWRAGRRFANYVRRGQTPIVFHLGDHDPSGTHMTIDNRERLEMFAGVPIQVVRLGLNMDQIRRLNPPPNPVKPKDARTPWYVDTYGTEQCWELDALPPDVIRGVIEGAVLKIRDQKRWDEALAQEASDKEDLDEVIAGMEGDGDG